MSNNRLNQGNFSRRQFLRGLQFAPALFLPAPLRALARPTSFQPLAFPGALHYADLRLTPHYPTSSPIDEMLQLVAPGTDQYITELYAAQIEQFLAEWGRDLTSGRDPVAAPQSFTDSRMRASAVRPASERKVRDSYGIKVARMDFSAERSFDRAGFLDELRKYISAFRTLRVAEFKITAIRVLSDSPLQVEADIRYTFVGENRAGGIEQRIGTWRTEWRRVRTTEWRVTKWQATDETVSHGSSHLFVDVTAQAFGHLTSYQQQLLHGADYWRTVLDGASGIDVYGNQGIAVGDYDGDGYDDIYVCQSAGLPNRLYRNRRDGTFEDVTEACGLNVLDPTSCALFADFENRGAQDLLVVTSSGPLLFVNRNGKFSLKENAFKFAQPPQGTFTHTAIADYDHDGQLDVYFCLYNYYAGLDQYRYPSPYFDARNGPPNFLFHNEGGWNFADHTEASGMSLDNNRYSFACAWGDANGNGWPDLYVANDFGRSNLYRNNGDGTFTSIAKEAGVEDVGAGMSACWFDPNGDGKQDIYVANMWSAAGLRVSKQELFHKDDPDDIRALYRRHARGNSLYQNLGDGKFGNAAAITGSEFGGWAWSSDSWDFDHDGHPDLYIANGYVSAVDHSDVASFFWRQVVGNSPRDLSPEENYEHGWNAINELIRSDHSWSGYERNVLYCNNHDGTFSDVSGISGLDFPDDARAFAVTDLDHDGRLEILIKNRNSPQLRLLQNAMQEIGNAIAFRLRGTKSNHDAIGAAITVEAQGSRQTKYLQAGSGFLSQHTKELFFGLGTLTEPVTVTVRWPSGAVHKFERVPVNHRVEISEASDTFHAGQFSKPAQPFSRTPDQTAPEAFPESVETWLLQPLRAPAFSLSDLSGKQWKLHEVPGVRLLTFWTSTSELSLRQLQTLADKPISPDLQILALNVEDPQNETDIRAFAAKNRLPFPVLTANPEVTGIYNITYRYLFDRHRDLGMPTSFLIDADGMIVKVYQGVIAREQIASDLRSLPRNDAERINKALPFPGTLHLGSFQRNDFTYGVAFFQRGYLDAAKDAFEQVIATKPDNAEAHYNLGTLYLRRNDLVSARIHLEKTVALKPDHVEAWNNLGMLSAEEGKADEAITDFKKSLTLRPNYSVALLNLGNIFRRERQFAEAEPLLARAVQLEPENAEANYSLGMLYAQMNNAADAEQHFQRAIGLRPTYADALNNYGVLLVRERRYSEAETKFQDCIQHNPNFDQAYLNLARLYVLLNDKDKAREVLQSLLREEPEHAVAQQTLKMLQ